MIDTVTVNETEVSSARISRFRWPWAYVQGETSRDFRLDFLRGFCVFVMTVNHISDFGPASWINIATGHGDFFITAAEGFVFISGLVMGMVYSKIIIKQGIGSALQKAFARMIKLYWVTVALTLFFVALAEFTPLKLWALREWILIKDPVEIVVGSLTLHFAFHGSSILIMFVLFLGIAIPALYGMSRGKWWIVLVISWVTWLGNFFYGPQFTIPFQSNFPFASWQVIFVTGMVIGYYKQRIIDFFSPRWRTVYAVIVGVLAIAGLVFYILDRTGAISQTFLAQLDYQSFMIAAEDKSILPVQRLFGIFLYLQAFYFLISWLWVPLQRALGWFFVTLGEAGMYAFIMHFAVVVAFYNIPGALSLPYFWYGLAQIVAVGALWLAVKTHFLYGIIPR